MKETVYVSGHKNPDTDSIISAIAYSHLLNSIGKYDAIPVRLGSISQETQYVLDRFDLETPILLKSVKQRVEDLDYDKVTVFSKELTLKTAWSLMKQGNLKAAPILDEHSQLVGLLSTSNIISGYMDEWDSTILAKSKASIENIVDTLDARVLHLNREVTHFQGEIHVAAMQQSEAKKRIKENDIVIVGGDREDAIDMLIEQKVSLIILTGSLKLNKTLLKKVKDANITTISTPYNSFVTSQSIIQAVPVEFVMQKGGLVTFNIHDTVDEVKEVMAETRYRSYPVLDLNGHVIGSISRYQLLKGERKKVIQVDHYERAQSIPGIEEADILEIIDHHRIGDMETMSPVYFRNQPVGCTATIITQMYQENRIEIEPNIAGLLCSAIISDTLMFRSPTCTPIDQYTAEYLADIAGINIEEYAAKMFTAGSNLSEKSPEEIFFQDFKKFDSGEVLFGVGQINSMNDNELKAIKSKLEEYMDKAMEQQGVKMIFFILTNILNQSSEVIYKGKNAKAALEAAFHVKEQNHSVIIPNLVSRKKQFIPTMMPVINEI
jgi:manganese-dependent inorganic pyrophosphatase